LNDSNSLDKALDLLRGVIPEGYLRLTRVLLNSAILTMDLIANKKISRKENRVGVFGPYSAYGKKIIEQVSEKMSKLGYGVITGEFFLLPNKPKEKRKIEEIMPSAVHTIKKIVPSYLFYQNFPRLVNKAIFYHNTERTQADELRGCFQHKIPSLLFITYSKIRERKNNCPFLFISKTHSECFVPEKDLCPYERFPVSCPFYDFINIPWATKELLMTEENAMIVTKNLDDLMPTLEKFIKLSTTR